MPSLTSTDGLTELQCDILAAIRKFVDTEILPTATELDHSDTYPTEIVAGLKELGVFGLTIAEEYGGLGEPLLTYALVAEEIARGWMSISGIINTHFIVSYMIGKHGTEEQKAAFLPGMAAGDIRAAFSMSEPELGSDVAAIKTTGRRDGDDYVISGQKMWLTNGSSSNLVALLARTDEGGARPHQNLTAFLIEKEPGLGQTRPGLTVPGKIDKMGYKGVDTTELVLDDCRVPASRVLGEQPGRGFYQMMDGIEVGRVNVAARGCGVASRAFELAIEYAQQRRAFGKPIAQHQAIEFKLAEMGTKTVAAHQMMVMAARRKDAGEQSDLEAGMAKYLASEYCKEVVEDALRIHGGYGYSKEYEIERLYRDAPMLLIGEGTAEIQKMIIGRRLLERFRAAQLPADFGESQMTGVVEAVWDAVDGTFTTMMGPALLTWLPVPSNRQPAGAHAAAGLAPGRAGRRPRRAGTAVTSGEKNNATRRRVTRSMATERAARQPPRSASQWRRCIGRPLVFHGTGARNGSQRAQLPPDSARLTQNVLPAQRLPVRPSPTAADTGNRLAIP